MTQQERPSPLRVWLSRYKPDRVRCTLVDGSVRELPKPSTTRGQWTQLEHAINLLQPSYLEAFRGAECVANRILDVEEQAPGAPGFPQKEETNPFAAMVAALPVVTQLIVDAGDASAARHQEAYKLAFDSLITVNNQYLQLVKVISDRLGGLERAWHKMILDRAAEAPGGDQNDGMAMSILESVMSRGQRPNGTNGASASAPPKDEPE